MSTNQGRSCLLLRAGTGADLAFTPPRVPRAYHSSDEVARLTQIAIVAGQVRVDMHECRSCISYSSSDIATCRPN